MTKKLLSELTDDEVFGELESRRLQLEPGDDDDVDAARAKLKEWILESGYEESYQFEFDEFVDNEVEEFSDSPKHESEAEEDKAEEEMETEEVKENEKEEEKKEDEEEEEDESNDSNDMFKEAATGNVVNEEADVLELDYGEDDDLDENKGADTPKRLSPEPPAISTQPEPISDDQPTTAEDPLDSSKLIWISNLPTQTKAADIREAYERLELTEAIVTCKIAVNKKTNNAFGFVEMPTVDAANKFIAEYNSNELCGAIVQIKKVERDPTAPKPKPTTTPTVKAVEKRKSDQVMMPPSQSNALVPKRAKTVINLKAKAAERETREKLSGYEKDLERMKRDLKREETEENRLKRERDDMAKKLRRKKDDADRIRRDNGRLRDQLRQVENTIRTEESSRGRMKEDLNVARRSLDQAREELRRLESSHRGMFNQEEEQRRRIMLERERLEAEKRRFAEERAQLEREQRERNYYQPPPPRHTEPMPSRNGHAAATQSNSGGIAYRSTGMNPTSRWPAGGSAVQVTTYNNQQARWPGESEHPERKVFSYENQSQRRYGNAGASRR